LKMVRTEMIGSNKESPAVVASRALDAGANAAEATSEVFNAQEDNQMTGWVSVIKCCK